jgi:hypothetical protein
MLKPRPATPATPAASPTAAGPRPLALVRAEAPVQEAAAAAPAAAIAPVAALHHTHSLFKLLAESAARSGTAGSVLLPLLASPQTGAELLEMQAAVLERLLALQQAWWQGWTGWLEEFGQLRRADTLSDYMEQQYNLCAQAGGLLKDQFTDVVGLQENVQVDCGYWAAQKLRQPPRA